MQWIWLTPPPPQKKKMASGIGSRNEIKVCEEILFKGVIMLP